jgi:hypothetical protein
MASTVVAGVLQAATPALTGLGALLARLTSLTRAQTGTLCVALAALPIGWQLKERDGAAEEATRIQAQLLDAQSQYATARSDLERLRADSQRLEQALVQANEAAKRAAESANAFDVWKKRMRTLLTTDDYRWSDESPFARIPKSVLPQLSRLSSPKPFSSPGIITPSARELLGLTPAECQSLEETLHRHFAAVERFKTGVLFETNQPLKETAVAATGFVIPPLPEDDVKQRANELQAGLQSALGEERWPLVQVKLKGDNIWSSVMNLNPKGEKLDISVWTNDHGALKWTWTGGAGGLVGYANGELSMFLPQGDPHRTSGSEGFGAGILSEAMRERASQWLQEQAVARLGKGGEP